MIGRRYILESRRSVGRSLAVLLVALLGLLWSHEALQAQPAQPLRLETAGQRIELVGLPPVLDEAPVRRQLDSGLTATFALTVTPSEGEVGGARVEVRYELWDEVYLAQAVGVNGGVVRQELADLEALAQWWRELRLPVLEGAADLPAAIRLDLVPFSEAEEQDTRRWLTASMAPDGDEARELGADLEGGESLGKVFNVLMATSIRRRAVFSQEWMVSRIAPPRPAGDPP
ncbi:MAG: hypothetical protein AAGD01_10500 [Acidobacteriota bacterium]